MGLIIDFIVIAIIGITVFLSARRGFVRMVVETAGFLAALWVALTFYMPLAEMTYDRAIEPSIVQSVSQAADNAARQTADSVWEALPQLAKTGLSAVGVTKESLDRTLLDHAGEGAQSAAENLSRSVVRPAVTRLLGLIYAVVLLIVLSLLVKLLAKMINRLFSWKLAGKINRLLGGLIGIPKGVVIAVLFCLLVSLLVSFRPEGVWIFTKDALKESWFFSRFSFEHFFTL